MTNGCRCCCTLKAPAELRRLAHSRGGDVLSGVVATPTASYRSVVAWRRRGRDPGVVVKLSLGTTVGRRRRRLSELNVAQGVVLSAVLDTIPAADRQRLRLEWMAEPCGVVDPHSRQGWLLRRLPRFMTTPGATTLLPLFSLISADGDRVPLLVRLVRRSRRRPEEFILERLIRPYVNAEAYLLFDQGVQHEGHTQNVLLEVDCDERLTGRLVLRDLTDTSVNIAFRVAKGNRCRASTAGRFHAPRRSASPATPATITRTSGARASCAASIRLNGTGSAASSVRSTRRWRGFSTATTPL